MASFDPGSAASESDGTVQEQIRRAASTAGVPFDIAYRLVKQESGFDPRAKSKAGAMGLTQLMPDTAKALGVGDPFNPADNLAGGMKYLSQQYKKYGSWQHALAAYNWGPGNVDSWLARGADVRRLPAETRQYVAAIAPGGLQKMGDRAHGRGGFDPSSAKPVAGGFDPSSAQPSGAGDSFYTHGAQPAGASTSHSFLQQLGGALDLPFEVGDAMVEGRLSGRGEFSKIAQIFKTDPATADDLFGYNAKPFLQYVVQHEPNTDEGRKAADLLAHPTKAAVETFIAEMLNPTNTIVGGGLGIGGKLVHGWLSQSEKGRAFLNLFSPFRNIAAIGGNAAAATLKALGTRIRARAGDAERTVESIFGGLTKDEKIDVVRRSQGIAGKVQSPRNISARAAAYRQLIKQTSAAKRNAGVLPFEYDEDLYAPMSQAYEHPFYDQETVQRLADLRGTGAGGALQTQVQFGQKVLPTIEEALQSGHLRPDFDPAVQLRKYLTLGRRNIEFEPGITQLGPKLIQPITQVNRTHPPVVNGAQMIRGRDLPWITSPALQNSWVHPKLLEWLAKHGRGVLTGETDESGLGKAFSGWNSALRKAIIANPAVHLVWNLGNNYAAAADAPLDAVKHTFKALVGAVPGIGEKMYDRLWPQAAGYAQDVKDAIAAGATAEMHSGESSLGGDIAHIRTSPWSELSSREKIDQVLTNVNGWNQRAVFGRTGEQAFAVDLYKRLRSRFPHVSNEEVGAMVREALGNYQNVDPNSIMSKAFFFWPWLKGNTAFWLKTFATKPQYTAAPLEAIRRHNQLAGDPNFGGQYPTKDLVIYRGKDRAGQAQYTTPLLPQRTAADIVNALGTRDPNEIMYTGQSLLRGHANPAVGALADLLTTKAARAKDPAMGANFNVVYDKTAPPVDKWKQIGKYLVGHGIPMPLIQYSVQDALRQNITPDQFGAELQQTMGLGFQHARASLEQTRAVFKAHNALERQVTAVQRAQQNGTITNAQAQARIQRAYKVYTARRNHIVSATSGTP